MIRKVFACAGERAATTESAAAYETVLTEGLMLFTAPGAKHFQPPPASLVRTVNRSVKKLLTRDGVAGLQDPVNLETRPPEKINE